MSNPARLRLCLAIAVGLCALGCGATSRDTTVARGLESRPSDLEIPIEQSLVVRGEWQSSEAHVARVRPGAYVRPPIGDGGERGVIVLEGARNVTLDLSGIELRGTAAGTDLDLNAGIGIVLRGCDAVTIRGGRIGGYKVCLAAFDCRDVVIDGVQFDGWYGQRLLSTRAAEVESDWLYPHHNDQGEWMKNYGAAIALEDCARAVVRNCRGRHGQNGILLTRSNECTLHDDDFSFLSGWGLALYRSSRNRVSHCIFDYCVRGYSHDVYWRGQDSAGILMFERCSDNVFVRNSATHGGDGVFLYAGNDIVEGNGFERGEAVVGGSDRNVWYDNDFSYAVANSIEATFSRDNLAMRNRLNGSHQHGVWGGYSSRLVIASNEIRGTHGGGVSIEHGQECAIVDNDVDDDDVGLELWWDEDESLVKGPFGKRFDTSSRDHLVLGNRFADNARDVIITSSTGLVFDSNLFRSKNRALSFERVSGFDARGRPVVEPRTLIAGVERTLPSGKIHDVGLKPYGGAQPPWLADALKWTPPELPGTLATFASERNERQGLDTIVMGPFGPWDFRAGEPRPKESEPGGLLAAVEWSAAWFAWQTNTDPRSELARWRALALKPRATGNVRAWNDPWGGDAARRAEIGAAHFGLVANATVDLTRGGTYSLTTLSDDGVRVILDGKVVLENWTWHGPTRDSVELELAAGKHEMTLEYFQIDGAYALSIQLEPH